MISIIKFDFGNMSKPQSFPKLCSHTTQATSVFCTELIPKEAIVSKELLGAEPQAKTRPQNMKDHELESLTINSLFIQLF